MRKSKVQNKIDRRENRLLTPISIIAIIIKMESELSLRDSHLQQMILRSIRDKQIPPLEIVSNVREMAEDKRETIEALIGPELTESILSLNNLTDIERDHMGRTGIILPGSKFIYWTKKKRYDK